MSMLILVLEQTVGPLMVNFVGAVTYSVVRTSHYFFNLLYDAIRISNHIASNGGMTDV